MASCAARPPLAPSASPARTIDCLQLAERWLHDGGWTSDPDTPPLAVWLGVRQHCPWLLRSLEDVFRRVLVTPLACCGGSVVPSHLAMSTTTLSAPTGSLPPPMDCTPCWLRVVAGPLRAVAHVAPSARLTMQHIVVQRLATTLRDARRGRSPPLLTAAASVGDHALLNIISLCTVDATCACHVSSGMRVTPSDTQQCSAVHCGLDDTPGGFHLWHQQEESTVATLLAAVAGTSALGGDPSCATSSSSSSSTCSAAVGHASFMVCCLVAGVAICAIPVLPSHTPTQPRSTVAAGGLYPPSPIGFAVGSAPLDDGGARQQRPGGEGSDWRYRRVAALIAALEGATNTDESSRGLCDSVSPRPLPGVLMRLRSSFGNAVSWPHLVRGTVVILRRLLASLTTAALSAPCWLSPLPRAHPSPRQDSPRSAAGPSRTLRLGADHASPIQLATSAIGSYLGSAGGSPWGLVPQSPLMFYAPPPGTPQTTASQQQRHSPLSTPQASASITTPPASPFVVTLVVGAKRNRNAT